MCIYYLECVNGFAGKVHINDTSIASIESYYNLVNEYYIDKYPGLVGDKDILRVINTHLTSRTHCQVIKHIQDKQWRNIIKDPVLVDTMYISSQIVCTQSFGNFLGSYLDSISCAQLSKLHYITLMKSIWEAKFEAGGFGKSDGVIPAFYTYLPSYIEYNYNVGLNEQLSEKQKWFEEELKSGFSGSAIETIPTEHSIQRSKDVIGSHDLMKKHCSYCSSTPHNVQRAAWSLNIKNICTILNYALAKHIVHNHIDINAYLTPETVKSDVSVTRVNEHDLSTSPVGAVLPLIPDVTIHYRCSDLFVNNEMGFLPTSKIVDIINNDPLTKNNSVITNIYIVAETRSRSSKNGLKCDALYMNLFLKLQAIYPHANIVVKRGDDMVSDMISLTYSKVTICSTSTFCLWFGIANPYSAYFPVTPLVYQHNLESTDNGHSLNWIKNPGIIFGRTAARMSTEELISKLNNF